MKRNPYVAMKGWKNGGKILIQLYHMTRTHLKGPIIIIRFDVKCIIVILFQVSNTVWALFSFPTAFSHHLPIQISAINNLTSVFRTWKIVSLLLLLFVPYSPPVFFFFFFFFFFVQWKIYSCFSSLLNGILPYDVWFKFQAEFTPALFLFCWFLTVITVHTVLNGQ